jgi:hypothetical protein
LPTYYEAFGKTPCSCSSTKFAELSKPEILTSLQKNLKQSVDNGAGSNWKAPVQVENFQSVHKMNQTEAITNKLRVVKWVIKSQYCDNCRFSIPMMASPVKINNIITVAIVMLIPVAILCR